MKLSQITKFERLNDISINVYALELNEVNKRIFYNVVPAKLTKNKLHRHVNLLLIQDKYFPQLNDYEAPPTNDGDIDEKITYHYCWKDEGRYSAKNLIASPRFHNRTIFDDIVDSPLMAIELKKAELIFNKPMYIGMCILDLSKTVMYDFHYNFMLQTLGVDNCKLLYTDTDSFIYEITSNDIYKDVIEANIHKFDTSDYDLDNIYGLPRGNKKILGLMKDEANGKIITNFVGLRSKIYSYKLDITDEEIEKERKGVK